MTRPSTFHKDSAKTRLIEAIREAFSDPQNAPAAPTAAETIERLKAAMAEAARLVD